MGVNHQYNHKYKLIYMYKVNPFAKKRQKLNWHKLTENS